MAANPYQVRVEWNPYGFSLTWEPQNGEDAQHGITGPLHYPGGQPIVLRSHPGGVHIYSEPEDGYQCAECGEAEDMYQDGSTFCRRCARAD